jgi:hypothetical protein
VCICKWVGGAAQVAWLQRHHPKLRYCRSQMAVCTRTLVFNLQPSPTTTVTHYCHWRGPEWLRGATRPAM